MKVQLDEGAYIPEKAHREDAGFDIRTPRDFVIHARSAKVIDTGIHIEVPYGFVGMILLYMHVAQK